MRQEELSPRLQKERTHEMKTEELRELENLVDEELEIVDVYRYPITKESILRIKSYFAQDEDLKVTIESSFPCSIEGLAKKYIAVFSRDGAQNA